MVAGLYRIWPNEASRQVDLRPGEHGEAVVDQVELLTPKNDRQAAIKAQTVSMVMSLRQTEWLLFLKMEQNAVPLPLLVVLVSWLAAIFIGFGLFAPPNPTVIVTLALGALAVSSAIFIILEMYTPFTGVLQITPTPIFDALREMGR